MRNQRMVVLGVLGCAVLIAIAFAVYRYVAQDTLAKTDRSYKIGIIARGASYVVAVEGQ